SYIQVRSAAARLPSAAAQRSTLFPYTTLFRSRRGAEPDRTDHAHLLRPDHLRRQQATETAEATHRGQRRKRSHHPATTGAVETQGTASEGRYRGAVAGDPDGPSDDRPGARSAATAEAGHDCFGARPGFSGARPARAGGGEPPDPGGGRAGEEGAAATSDGDPRVGAAAPRPAANRSDADRSYDDCTGDCDVLALDGPAL